MDAIYIDSREKLRIFPIPNDISSNGVIERKFRETSFASSLSCYANDVHVADESDTTWSYNQEKAKVLSVMKSYIGARESICTFYYRNKFLI